jgi:streptogramin lyase
MNGEKVNESGGGEDAVVVGSVDNGTRNCSNTPYQMITRHSQNNPLTVTADENGGLWLFVGTDSGFEGRTELYYDSIEIHFRLQ